MTLSLKSIALATMMTVSRITIAAYWCINELKAVVERQGFKPIFR